MSRRWFFCHEQGRNLNFSEERKMTIKKKYLIIYLILIAVCGLLMLCRWLNSIDPSIILLPDYLLLHITNFAICTMLLLVFGYVVLLCGGKMMIITIVAILVAILSTVYECFLPMINTPDIWDAVFGVAGIAIAYVYLAMLRKRGLTVKQINLDL